LHYAAREGRVEMVHYFLQAAPETAAIATDKGKLAVHFSAGDGHLAITSALLRQFPQSAALPSTKGKLPLHFCARWGYLDIAHELLRVYPDAVRALDFEGSLPLHDAAREGQYRMSRYLIERFPVALQTANLRGEIPLFSAVRSGNVDLVTLMIQAWPMGGKHILRNVSADDIIIWNSDILELLLRGAVNNLRGCTLLEGREPPTVRLTDDVQPIDIASPEELKAQKKAKKAMQSGQHQQQPRLVETPHRWAPAAVAAAPFASLNSSYPVLLPSLSSAFASMPFRSKSPILSSGCSGRSSGSLGDKKKHVRKRSRQMSADEALFNGKERIFIPLHATFESKAACHVIQHALEEHPEDNARKDERGRLPLHWAVTHCHDQDAVVNLVLSKENGIFTPAAARTADSTGKLPLHMAIASRADVRVIKALLEAHPAAGVELCRTRDRFDDKTPIHMATHYGCDLSTVFELLRVDPSFVRHQ
jgi:ankyrin repeat protein